MLLNNHSLRRTLRAIALQKRALSPLIVFSGSDAEIDAAECDWPAGWGSPTHSLLPARGAHHAEVEATPHPKTS